MPAAQEREKIKSAAASAPAIIPVGRTQPEVEDTVTVDDDALQTKYKHHIHAPSPNFLESDLLKSTDVNSKSDVERLRKMIEAVGVVCSVRHGSI
jgi:hypothetical protein